MNRLVDTVDTALAIGDTAQTGRREQTQRAGDDTSFVANDITKEVARDHDTVQLARVFDHQHSSRVNEVVTDADLGVFLLHDLGDNLTPETTGSEDIGLVQAPNGEGRVMLKSKVGSEADDTLDFDTGVGLSVHGVTRAVILLALAEVDTASQLTDDVEVNTAAHIGLEGRAVDQRGGGEVAGTQVTECAHLLAQFQDTLLRADGAGTPFLCTA